MRMELSFLSRTYSGWREEARSPSRLSRIVIKSRAWREERKLFEKGRKKEK